MVIADLSARLLIIAVTIPRLRTVTSMSFCLIFPFQSLGERFSLQWSFEGWFLDLQGFTGSWMEREVGKIKIDH